MVFITALLAALSLAAPASNLIPGQYIVVFKDHVKDTKTALEKYMNDMRSQAGFAAIPESAVVQQYDTVLKGATVKFPDSLVDAEPFVNEDVAFIEQDQWATVLGTQTGAPWGLNRISSRANPGSSATYTYPDSAGSGVTAYVIDTGVLTTHPSFEGRAVFGADFSGDGSGDGNGHGTHVAGTIASRDYGVAKKAKIVAVRVLGSNGSGTNSGVIAGIEWATKDSKGKKAVANMSLGGGASAAVDNAVKAATNAGLVMVVAAGNSQGDACNLSPARAPTAITVAASDINDKLASFSEKGPCVDIIAPGVNILSTWNNGATRSISGTSMASPHVAGVVALALAEGSFSSVAAVHDYIKSIATPGKISGTLNGAPNALLYNKVDGGKVPA